jgi:hypothetical protein
MSLNAMLIRSAVLMAVAAILAVSASQRMPAAHAASSVALAPASSAADALPIVELPTIEVRPSAADLIAAQSDAGSEDGVFVDAAADSFYESLTPNMPSLRMDMPYYSFGKALRRGVKE